MVDLLQLERDLAELQAKVIAERERVKGETLEALRAMLASGTLTPDDLLVLLPKVPRDRTPKREPKYRDPVSGNTWSGDGRTPKWAEGKDLATLLIKP